MVASSSSSSALVPDVHSAKASSRRSEPVSSFRRGFHPSCSPANAGVFGCALDSPESLRVRGLSCSCVLGPCAGGQPAFLDLITRVYDRPVCVTCGAILSFSMPVLSRHWHTGVVVSASAKSSCHVLRVATVALCALPSTCCAWRAHPHTVRVLSLPRVRILMNQRCFLPRVLLCCRVVWSRGFA